MEWQLILALVLGVPIALFPVAFVGWCFAGGGVACRAMLEARQKKKRGLILTCTADAECTSGYVCVNGICVPAH